MIRESYDRYMYRKYREHTRTVDLRRAMIDDGYMIFDDVLDTDICEQLRTKALGSDLVHTQYHDYRAVDYSSFHCDNLEIKELVCKTVPSLLEQQLPLLKTYQYQRGWYFIHDLHQTQSVGLHADPGAYITCNLWVTPDDHIDDKSKQYNGMTIHAKNGPVTVPYKYNRMVVFLSDQMHRSQLARFKQHKVNFTFLYN